MRDEELRDHEAGGISWAEGKQYYRGGRTPKDSTVGTVVIARTVPSHGNLSVTTNHTHILGSRLRIRTLG